MNKEQIRRLRTIEECLNQMERHYREGWEWTVVLRYHLSRMWQEELPLTTNPVEIPSTKEQMT